jgi:hypothetical protein
VTFHPEFSAFLRSLKRHRVRFLVVGAHALAVHGRPRYTGDLDVWVEPTRANASRVVAALRDFGYPGYAEHEAEFSTLDRMTHLGVEPLRIDVMTSVSGLVFADAWNRRVRASVVGISVGFLSRDDLVLNKRASGRAKDLADLALLAENDSPRSGRRAARRLRPRARR